MLNITWLTSTLDIPTVQRELPYEVCNNLLLDILFVYSLVRLYCEGLPKQIKARREEGICRCQLLQKKAPTISSAAATTTTTSASIDATISTRYKNEGGISIFTDLKFYFLFNSDRQE